MSHPRTYTIEDWMTEYHPELEDEIPLEPGMVFWRTTSVGDGTGDVDGFYVVYLRSGVVERIFGGVTVSSTDSDIRNRLHTGIYEPVDVEDLSEDLRSARIERLNEERDNLAELIERLRADDNTPESYLESLEADLDALTAALDDG
jgi:hypothetical protein